MGQRNGHLPIARPATLFGPRRKMSWALIAWNVAYVVWWVVFATHVTHIGKFGITRGVVSDAGLISSIWFGGLIVLSVVWAATRKDLRRRPRGYAPR